MSVPLSNEHSSPESEMSSHLRTTRFCHLSSSFPGLLCHNYLRASNCVFATGTRKSRELVFVYGLFYLRPLEVCLAPGRRSINSYRLSSGSHMTYFKFTKMGSILFSFGNVGMEQIQREQLLRPSPGLSNCALEGLNPSCLELRRGHTSLISDPSGLGAGCPSHSW